MVIDSDKYDPIDYYKDILKNGCHENSQKYFDELVKKSKINTGENHAAVKKIKAFQKVHDASKKTLSTYKGWKRFLIILAVVGIICAIWGAWEWGTYEDPGVLEYCLIGIGIPVAIISLLIVYLYLNKKIKEMQQVTDEQAEKLYKMISEARSQLTPLLSLFNYKDFNKISNKTTNMFTIDDELDPEKLLMLENLYNYDPALSKNESILDVMSGDINTNPYIRIRVLKMSIYKHCYTGTRTVTWTESYTDSEGRSHTRTESETLVAHVYEDAPSYRRNCYLIYGNEAAPDLTFLRVPSGIKMSDDEGDVKKFVSRKEKKLAKKSQKAVMENKSFQAMANTEFETLFGATNRNHEVQYRLLFTPLAQQNMVEVITAKEPYGDDFAFHKIKKINIISSKHGVSIFNYNPNRFDEYYDFEALRNDYVEYIKSLFSSIYFDLAPILAIPLYQMTDAGEYNIRKNLRYITDYEAESLVNHMKLELFKHQETTTDQILKVKFNGNNSNGNEFFTVTSFSFKAIPQVKVVPVLCRNGSVYDVTVHYYIYEPLEQQSQVAVRKINETGGSTNRAGIDGINARNKNYVGRYFNFDKKISDNDQNEFVNYVKNNYNQF